jgi:hypothetical protein
LDPLPWHFNLQQVRAALPFLITDQEASLVSLLEMAKDDSRGKHPWSEGSSCGNRLSLSRWMWMVGGSHWDSAVNMYDSNQRRWSLDLLLDAMLIIACFCVRALSSSSRGGDVGDGGGATRATSCPGEGAEQEGRCHHRVGGWARNLRP